MGRKKTIITTEGHLRYQWSLGEPGSKTVHVDVFLDDEKEPFMEWVYSTDGLGRSLIPIQAFWQPQARVQAEAEVILHESKRSKQ